LLAFALLGAAAWWGLDALLAWAGIDTAHFAAAEGLRGLASLLGVILGGWILWRVLAIAVMQVFADEVVAAVEARHFPAALAAARPPGWNVELATGAKAAARALLANLVALPFALVLLITGIGTPLLFWAVNALLLGRELTEMVWLRHAHAAGAPVPLPLPGSQRFLLGGIVAALLLVPFINLLAPFLGAAMATHLVHTRKALPHAT
jgi:CysZ protein